MKEVIRAWFVLIVYYCSDITYNGLRNLLIDTEYGLANS